MTWTYYCFIDIKRYHTISININYGFLFYMVKSLINKWPLHNLKMPKLY
jgi:hypothetical protein